MGKGKSLSPLIRAQIVQLKEQGMSFRAISKMIKCSTTACHQAWKLHQETEQFCDRLRSSRPRKTDVGIDKQIRRMSEKDRKKTAVDIARKISHSYNINITPETIRSHLCRLGLFGRVSKKKPLVSVQNRRHRLAFARRHQHWTPEQWRAVLFSDEKKFNQIGSDGRVYVRRKMGEAFAPQCLRPTVKGGGGSVMAWACFSAIGTGPIHRIQGIMTAKDYEKIIEEVLKPYPEDVLPLNWIYQQNNDPKHRARIVQQWFMTNQIRVLDWSSQSPDLNPIKNLCSFIQKEVQKHQPRNLDDLFRII
uniref:Transposase n=1 Tax=Plectus sambesii TaxID=2011161 RepID=A0A914V505_9BILA